MRYYTALRCVGSNCDNHHKKKIAIISIITPKLHISRRTNSAIFRRADLRVLLYYFGGPNYAFGTANIQCIRASYHTSKLI